MTSKLWDCTEMPKWIKLVFTTRLSLSWLYSVCGAYKMVPYSFTLHRTWYRIILMGFCNKTRERTSCLFALPVGAMLPGREFTYPDRLPTGRTKSSDWESRQKLSTPVAASVLRQHNAAAPHTVGPCHVRRLSFLKSLSTNVPHYQRDIEASRLVPETAISSQTCLWCDTVSISLNQQSRACVFSCGHSAVMQQTEASNLCILTSVFK